MDLADVAIAINNWGYLKNTWKRKVRFLVSKMSILVLSTLVKSGPRSC